ncbi:hypothetical protein RHGRI_024647 [Rhododendron griersonianum]|uniref:Uncharacterized protein n=1 Tax=Rhododendron griersonianum TaxID=479676 RepID=A0AAV6J7W0_9ERIC|nr:hypothetical protein RHGRI_024647 [Rhododendron griersonianum]
MLQNLFTRVQAFIPFSRIKPTFSNQNCKKHNLKIDKNHLQTKKERTRSFSEIKQLQPLELICNRLSLLHAPSIF